MGYDFTTLINRANTGSGKWDRMLLANPNVSKGVIPLSVADMELKCPPEVMEGLKEFLSNTVLGYAEATPSYYSAVTSWMKQRHGWEALEEWIVLTPGVVSAVYAAVNAFTDEGDGVIIQPPVYYPFAMAVNDNRRKLVTNPLIIENGMYRMDYSDLEAKAKDPKNKLLILCSPHNPVGRVWTREELETLSEICLKHNVFVVSDEIHFDLLLNGAKHTVYAELSEEAKNNSIICTAPSKTFNLAGMQASNIFAPNKAAHKKLQGQYIRQAQLSLNIMGVKACEIAYTKCAPWLDELIGLLESNQKLVSDFFKGSPITCYPLEGTYLQWLDFRCLGMNISELERFMQFEAEWFTDEGYLFGEEGNGFERINLACPEHVILAALERLKKALKPMLQI